MSTKNQIDQDTNQATPVEQKIHNENKIEEYRIPLRSGFSLFAREVVRGGENTSKKRTTKLQQTARIVTHHQNNNNDDDDDDDDIIMIVVHGGPGLADHTESFEGLRHIIDDECGDSIITKVIFYDQLGCGQSDKPPPTSSTTIGAANSSSSDEEEDIPIDMYSLQFYVDELRQVIEHVSLRHQNTCTGLCLLGHSWGGQIVLELLLSSSSTTTSLLRRYVQQQTPDTSTTTSSSISSSNSNMMLRLPILCAIISNTPLDESTYETKQKIIRSELDEEMRKFYEDDEAKAAMDGSVGNMIYHKLIGISETNIIGEMKGWSVLSRSHRHNKPPPSSLLFCPCLFISGTDDTIPYEEYNDYVSFLNNNSNSHKSDKSTTTSAATTNTVYKQQQQHKAVIIDGAGHGPFFGETSKIYFKSINNFLRTTRYVQSKDK